MALLHRFSRLLSADLHAVIDRLEDPAVLLQQAQREMAAALADERALLQRIQALRTQANTRLERLEDQLTKLQEELDLCFDAEDEALARSVIKRRLQCSADQAQLNAECQGLQEQESELLARIAQHERDLATITAEAEHLADQAELQPHCVATEHSAGISEEAVELALLAERRARSSGVRS